MSTHSSPTRLSVVLLVLIVAACSDAATPPTSPRAAASASADRSSDGGISPGVALVIRQLAAQRGLVAMPAAPRVRPELVKLGQALMFDPILSGRKNISCATCHFPAYAMGDGKSLSVGEGGVGLGPTREHPQGVFIPRNAPALFDVGMMKHLFWDGRVQVAADGSISTPAGAQVTPAMQRTFEFGPASALGMFPVTNHFEMRGQPGTSALADIPDSDNPAIWSALMQRLGEIPEYRALFEAAYPGTRFRDMTFAHASNAIGGFLVAQLTFGNAPWDRFLRGDDNALTPRQAAGAQTFLSIKCSICHTGATLSDDAFHDVAIAQLGPGEGDGASGRDDFGRMRVTGDPADRYLFRTTPLRNVELTGPYGHDGAITDLRAFIDHYSESDVKLLAYDPMQLEPSLQSTLLPSATDILAQRDTIIRGVVLSSETVDALVDYMSALTDPAARTIDRLIPARAATSSPRRCWRCRGRSCSSRRSGAARR